MQHYHEDEDKQYTPAVDRVIIPYLKRPHPSTGVALSWCRIQTGPDSRECSDGGVRVSYPTFFASYNCCEIVLAG
jgi:hypothetical protein